MQQTFRRQSLLDRYRIPFGGNKGIRWEQLATFEGGMLTPNPTGFDAVNGAGLAITEAAALLGKRGCAVTINGAGTESYGTFVDTNNENDVSFEFFLNCNDLPMNIGQQFWIHSMVGSGPGDTPVVLQLQRVAAGYNLLLYYRPDSGALVWVPATARIYAVSTVIRSVFHRSSGVNDGFVYVYVNGNQMMGVSGIDNDQQDIDSINCGAVAALAAGMAGTYFIDDCKWTREIHL